MCLAPIGFTFLLPKSQLQGHFSLFPAVEKPSYLKLSLMHCSGSEKVRVRKSSNNHYKHLFHFSLRTSGSNTQKLKKTHECSSWTHELKNPIWSVTTTPSASFPYTNQPTETQQKQQQWSFSPKSLYFVQQSTNSSVFKFENAGTNTTRPGRSLFSQIAFLEVFRLYFVLRFNRGNSFSLGFLSCVGF